MKIAPIPCLLVAACLSQSVSLRAQPPGEGMWLGNGAYVDKDTNTYNRDGFLNGVYTNSADPGRGVDVHHPIPDEPVAPVRWDNRPLGNFYASRLVFPASPPLLGESAGPSRQPAAPAEGDSSIQDGQSAYDPFYVPARILASQGRITSGQRQSLDQYRTLRASLLASLRARLAALQNADNDTRGRALAAFAQEQAGPLDELEVSAEKLRAVFARDVMRKWENGFWRAEEPSRVQATSFYPGSQTLKIEAVFQAGYSLAQRFLLREMAMDSDPHLHTAIPEGRKVLAISPATARVSLPASMPAELATKVSAYKIEKAALKGELREIIRAQYETTFDFNRARALQALAEKQAPRFARLETLADEIRAGFATVALDLQDQLVNRDYHDAVMEPGLSPAQRRLLLGAAMETPGLLARN